MEWALIYQLYSSSPEASWRPIDGREHHLSRYACELARDEFKLIPRGAIGRVACVRVLRPLPDTFKLRGTTSSRGPA